MKYRYLEKNILESWIKLRESLETSDNPFNEVVSFFSKQPSVKIYTDPYDQSSWPTPWELILENMYCPFNFILGVCYTLQLTERFKTCQPKIHIAFDNSNKTVYYLLIVHDKVYGYLADDWCDVSHLPKSLKTKKLYSMKSIH
jgi:hypothetical protein